MVWRVDCDNALSWLEGLPAGVASVCVTSPPYWQLRDYGTGTWHGGDPGCKHRRGNARADHSLGERTGTRGGQGSADAARTPMAGACSLCGAVREDAQLGLEPLHDCAGWATGEPCGCCYVCHLVAVFRGVRRALHPSGTLWLNLGDGYASSPAGNLKPRGEHGNGAGKFNQGGPAQERGHHARSEAVGGKQAALAPKNLLMIPARVALALQADGWVLRNEVVWMKRSPMPESCRDRMTSATERVYLFATRGRYFYDQEAERVPCATTNPEDPSWRANGKSIKRAKGIAVPPGQAQHSGIYAARDGNPDGRNLWNYWLDTDPEGWEEEADDAPGALPDAWHLGSEPQKHSHYAAYPSVIPRRAIRLGSSARGVCPDCRAPWVRIVEREKATRERPNDHVKRDGTEGTGNACANTVAGTSTRILGWRPTCPCGREPVAPVVLDPFCGSGVSGVVAVQEGRDFWGCDLSPRYAGLARRRIGGECPLFS